MANPKMPHLRDGFKTCSACHSEKELSCFDVEPRVKSGLTARCKDCVRGAHTEWAKRNPERVDAARKKYAKKYPERVSEARNFTNRRVLLERQEERIRKGNSLIEPRETDDGRRCSKCKRRKPRIEFGPDAGHHDGVSCYCRECRNKVARDQSKKGHAKAYRESYMREYGFKKYGLTGAEFDRIIEFSKSEMCYMWR